MSSLVINGDTSGSITLAAPAVAGSNTLTLPTLTGTVLTNKTAGTVLQVVQATYGTEVSSSTGTYIDTGLTANITPSSSSNKILVLVSQNGIQKRTGNTYMGLQLQRSGSSIAQMAVTAAGTGDTSINDVGTVSINYLDSPATTASITYKTQFNSNGLVAATYVQRDSALSSIILMEIAA